MGRVISLVLITKWSRNAGLQSPSACNGRNYAGVKYLPRNISLFSLLDGDEPRPQANILIHLGNRVSTQK